MGLGFKTNPAPKNDAEFRKALVGRTLLVDIKKDRKQVKNKATGKYERVDEYENVLVYKPSSKRHHSNKWRRQRRSRGLRLRELAATR